jgi:hypothetical protein
VCGDCERATGTMARVGVPGLGDGFARGVEVGDDSSVCVLCDCMSRVTY